MSLMEKRKKVKTYHTWLEKEGAPYNEGWHPSHKSSPQQLGTMPLSKRLVAFQDEFETYFVGDCAKQVVAALAKYPELVKGVGNPNGDQRAALKVAMEYKDKLDSESSTGEAMLKVRNAQYNAVLYCLETQGIQTSTTDLQPMEFHEKFEETYKP